ncbi:MAG: hypothetical protein ACKO9T_09655 [Nitrospira sp.]
MKQKIGVGLIGWGTVGTGVAKILLGRRALITRRVGVPIELVRVADLDTTRDRGIALPPGVLINDAKALIDDPAVDIVIELIGGYDAAKKFILEALAQGKPVVTANMRCWPYMVRKFSRRWSATRPSWASRPAWAAASP